MPLSLAKGLHKTEHFNNVRQKTVANRANACASLMPYPTYDFDFSLDSITGSEAAASSTIAQFKGTYIACNAGGNLFLFTDPQDNSVSYGNSGMLNVTAGAATGGGAGADPRPGYCRLGHRLRPRQ